MNEELRDEVAGVLGEHGPSGSVNSRECWVECECGERLYLPSGLTFDGYPEMWEEERKARDAHLADALMPLLERREREAAARALRLPREVEAEMSDTALTAWRSADARRGLSDHEALLVHADTLTRWSERFRMAFDGQDYRTDAATEDAS